MKRLLEIKSCLIGMLLGDGYLHKVSPTTARFALGHSVKQKDYLLWKVKLLEQLTSVDVKEYTNPQGYQTVTARTKTLPFYGTLRNQMYWHGRKSINNHLMDILDEKGIALWFYDDGCLDRSAAVFCTYNFNEPEQYLMKESLARRHGIHTSVGRRKHYYYLRTCVKDTEKVVNWTKELGIPSMEYKTASYCRHSDMSRNDLGQYKPGFNGNRVGEIV